MSKLPLFFRYSVDLPLAYYGNPISVIPNM